MELNLDRLNATDNAALRFAHSRSMPVGAIAGDNALQTVRDNAPALVGAMRLIAALLPPIALAMEWDVTPQLRDEAQLLGLHGAGILASEAV